MSRRFFLVAAVAGFLGLSAWLGFQTYREFRRGEEIRQYIDRLKQEEQQVVKDNLSRRENNQYLKTDDFEEREAKEKLHYQEPGERLVILQNDQPTEDKNVSFFRNDTAGPSVVFRKPNYQLWWEQFF